MDSVRKNSELAETQKRERARRVGGVKRLAWLDGGDGRLKVR